MLRRFAQQGITAATASSALPLLSSAAAQHGFGAVLPGWSAASWPGAAISYRGVAADSSTPATTSAANPGQSLGAKQILKDILLQHGALTSDQVWERAQTEGLKSKRFTKHMLNMLKQEHEVYTVPPSKAEEMGFENVIPSKPKPALLKSGKRKKTKVNRFMMVYCLPVERQQVRAET